MIDLCGIFISIWIICSIFALLALAVNAENKKISIAKSLKEFVVDLFDDKNLFGILLCILICIFLIPVYIYILIIKIIYIFHEIFIQIWKLGVKK